MILVSYRMGLAMSWILHKANQLTRPDGALMSNQMKQTLVVCRCLAAILAFGNSMGTTLNLRPTYTVGDCTLCCP